MYAYTILLEMETITDKCAFLFKNILQSKEHSKVTLSLTCFEYISIAGIEFYIYINYIYIEIYINFYINYIMYLFFLIFCSLIF